jgi:uncharacterized repeat protein (TIGR04076 family)
VIDDPEIVLEKTDALCTHALSSLLHYVLVLERGADPVELGLSKPEDRENAYIQCVDPGEPYTHGGTVIFRCRRIDGKSKKALVAGGSGFLGSKKVYFEVLNCVRSGEAYAGH